MTAKSTETLELSPAILVINNNNNNKVYFRQDVHICIHKIQLKKKKVQYI